MYISVVMVIKFLDFLCLKILYSKIVFIAEVTFHKSNKIIYKYNLQMKTLKYLPQVFSCYLRQI